MTSTGWEIQPAGWLLLVFVGSALNENVLLISSSQTPKGAPKAAEWVRVGHFSGNGVSLTRPALVKSVLHLFLTY